MRCEQPTHLKDMHPTTLTSIRRSEDPSSAMASGLSNGLAMDVVVMHPLASMSVSSHKYHGTILSRTKQFMVACAKNCHCSTL